MLKDHGRDHGAGPAYGRYERVRVERNYTIAINKEDHLREMQFQRTGPPRFTMNCLNAQKLGSLLALKNSHSRLEVIADKVEKRSPEERGSLEGFDHKSMEVKAQRQAEKIPSQKTDLPSTRAQEIGWLLTAPASHSYVQHRRRKKAAGESGTSIAEPEANLTQAASPKPNPYGPPGGHLLQHSRSAPSLSAPEPLVPLGQPIQGVHTLNNRRFYKPKTFCPITKYADTYMSLMHHDPFHQSATR